jgi:TonB family protein
MDQELKGSTIASQVKVSRYGCALLASQMPLAIDIKEISDHVVEITIDETGNIVQKVVLHSLGPAVDGRLLAALEKWHFAPASKNGVPIPSKQDVYYHFPR